jgi:hypothetical protein
MQFTFLGADLIVHLYLPNRPLCPSHKCL